jgi:hypothetical protein
MKYWYCAEKQFEVCIKAASVNTAFSRAADAFYRLPDRRKGRKRFIVEVQEITEAEYNAFIEKVKASKQAGAA